MKIIYTTAIAILLTTLVSCGTKKAAQSSVPKGETEITLPCSGSEYMSNSDFLRANAMGFSSNLEVASQKALLDARAKLAASIQSVLESSSNKYISSYENGMNDETVGRYQSFIKSAVDQTIDNSRIICQKTTRTDDNKQYRSYVAIEVSSNEVLQKHVEFVNSDSKLKTVFEYEKYKKEHDKTMSEYKVSQ